MSVHTIVSFDFAISVIPGWHATIFPPYFVAGAIYSGFAMVLTLAIPIRKVYGLQDFITERHLNNMAKILLVTGLIVAYGYMIEAFMAWYSANTYEVYMMRNRMTGPYGPFYWALLFCNVLTPQFLWIKKIRTNVLLLFIISLIVNVGMWLERFVIVVTSLHRDFLPSSWGRYEPTMWDWGLYVGTIGLFLALLFLFLRFLPMISIFEMRTLVPDKPPDDPAKPDTTSGRRRRDETVRTPEDLRLDGGVRDVARARRGGAPRASRGLSQDGRVLAGADRRAARRAAHARQPPAEDRAARRHPRRARRLRPSVLGVDDRVSDERRRASAAQLADVHSGDVRDDDSGGRAVGGARHAGAQRAAAAVSSGVQRAALRAGEPQPVLPVHRVAGSEVQHRSDAARFSNRSAHARSRPLKTETGYRRLATGCRLARGRAGRSLTCAACRQDMHDQPKYTPYKPSDFFADQRSARPAIEGTVAQGQLFEDELLYTGTHRRTAGDGVSVCRSMRR